jgi:hypothetical protein
MPTLRPYIYNEHCVCKVLWQRSVLASAAWFRSMMATQSDGGLQLRKLNSKQCVASRLWLEWHLAYFLSTDQILNKFRGFSHSLDKHVVQITSSASPHAQIEQHIADCMDMSGTRLHARQSPGFDGRLPRLPDWPRSVAASYHFSATDVETERRGASKRGAASDARIREQRRVVHKGQRGPHSAPRRNPLDQARPNQDARCIVSRATRTRWRPIGLGEGHCGVTRKLRRLRCRGQQ